MPATPSAPSPAKSSVKPARASALKTRLVFVLALLALLAACRPDLQLSGQTGNQNAEIIDLPSIANTPTPTAQQIAAAKARVPYQYHEKKPLNLFDYATNLNPGGNRSSPAN
jgi:hypothetical protein